MMLLSGTLGVDKTKNVLLLNYSSLFSTKFSSLNINIFCWWDNWHGKGRNRTLHAVRDNACRSNYVTCFIKKTEAVTSTITLKLFLFGREKIYRLFEKKTHARWHRWATRVISRLNELVIVWIPRGLDHVTKLNWFSSRSSQEDDHKTRRNSMGDIKSTSGLVVVSGRQICSFRRPISSLIRQRSVWNIETVTSGLDRRFSVT